ncbi:MAG TPA: hypothetical protein VIA06_14515 [Candidatus Dormibacteraeota bacterium]|nr:hypothetical protein [Candidatus Dormibacteraeota bacterium]
MSADPVAAIARAVLYEGYLLYPYTRSSAKNQVRWTFGGVHPPAWAADPSVMQTECLVQPASGWRVEIAIRCLQLLRRTAPGEPVWQEAQERTVASLALAPGAGAEAPVELAAGSAREGEVVREWERIQGLVRASSTPLEGGAARITVRIENTTPTAERPERDEALLRTLVSTHTVLRVEGGRFCSLADPPPGLREAAAACANQGTWPVPVGEPGSGDVLLSSPIILEDYPRIAEQSPGDLFDATEIDEILTLRILTLSDTEKAELRRTDARAAELLDRTEEMGAEDLMRLHGTLREMRPL